MILFLAANTSFNAFPRLAAILARDGYMPRQFSFRGDRLAFTSGIVILSITAIAVIAAFGGVVTALIPLYAVGVFAAFTIGQVGMVRHWLKERTTGWQHKLGINAFGATLTFLVFVVVLVAKAPTSLLIAVVVPLMILVMVFIHRQYRPRPSTWRFVRTQSFPRRDVRSGSSFPSRASTAPSSRRSTSVAPSRPTCARCSSPTSPRKPPSSASAGSARFPTCRW